MSLVWLASAWIATLGNWPLWSTMNGLPEMSTLRGRLFMLAFCGMVLAATAAVLTLAAWRWTIKPVITVFLLAAAAGAHFMGTYNVVIDSPMIVNVLQTDGRETRDLLNARLFIGMLVIGVLPLFGLWPVGLQRLGAWRQIRRNLASLIGAIVLLLALVLAFFADVSGTMRNHRTMRYLVNPLNSFYSLAMVGVAAQRTPRGPPVVVGADAKIAAPASAAALPPLLLLVIGETARADHFSLNGYARPTNPQLSTLDVLSFRNVTSCGTSTATSLPCMFSVFGKASFESEKQLHENLLDVMQRAGLAVLWVDNQSGCKDICNRVMHAQASDAAPGGKAPLARLCQGGECLDEALLSGLDARLIALPEAARARGVVVVLHQMGSHGPAYAKRSPPDRKPFKPECETNVLQQCEPQALINAYDNSIAYTDQVLADAIGWLKGRAASHTTALLYVSDHGESLGENNLYLHGLPYAFAPREQKHVPMVMWFSPAQAASLKPECMNSRLDIALSHDNLPHTVLGLMRVQTSVYKPALDAVAPCRAQ